jgi:hypothetical protein
MLFSAEGCSTICPNHGSWFPRHHLAPCLFIWTVYANEDEASIEINGLRGREHVESGLNEPLSGLSPKSIWLTLPSLLELLKRSGYRNIEVLEKQENRTVRL